MLPDEILNIYSQLKPIFDTQYRRLNEIDIEVKNYALTLKRNKRKKFRRYIFSLFLVIASVNGIFLTYWKNDVKTVCRSLINQIGVDSTYISTKFSFLAADSSKDLRQLDKTQNISDTKSILESAKSQDDSSKSNQIQAMSSSEDNQKTITVINVLFSFVLFFLLLFMFTTDASDKEYDFKKEKIASSKLDRYMLARDIYDFFLELEKYIQNPMRLLSGISIYCLRKFWDNHPFSSPAYFYSRVAELSKKYDWFQISSDSLETIRAYRNLLPVVSGLLFGKLRVDRKVLLELQDAIICLAVYEFMVVKNKSDEYKVGFTGDKVALMNYAIKLFTLTIHKIDMEQPEKLPVVQNLKSKIGTFIKKTSENRIPQYLEILNSLKELAPLFFVPFIILWIFFSLFCSIFNIAFEGESLTAIIALAAGAAMYLKKRKSRLKSDN